MQSLSYIADILPYIRAIMKFPEIMGILNVTPDSFSDGGDFTNTDIAVNHAIKMSEMGADIIDIGGESTRPGAAKVSQEDELARVIPVIEGIKKRNSEIKISIDTSKAEVARQAVKAGAEIINDISAMSFEEKIADVAAEHNCSLVLMHMQGKPGTMQENPYYEDVVAEVYDYLENVINKAKAHGVKNVIADVGIGFGKRYEDNIELLKNHDKFQGLNVPLLLGISRKRFIGSMLDIEKPKERDLATTLIHTMMLNSNINIIRVHNVEYMNQARIIFNSLKK